MPLIFKEGGHPTGHTYSIDWFTCPSLHQCLADVENSLDMKSVAGKICQLSNDVYVHVYDPDSVIPCSKLTLSEVAAFFIFHQSTEKHDFTASSIDVEPFHYSSSDLVYLGKCSTEVRDVIQSGQATGEYAWAGSPYVSWDWNENVWTEGLYHCLLDAPALEDVRVIPAYRWGPKTYCSSVGTVFRNIVLEPTAPFQGMTDILLVGNHKVALIRSIEFECVCCVEIGIRYGPTYSLVIEERWKIWPEKMGELLASMYYYGSNFLNNFRNCPTPLTWTCYGIFVM